LVIGDWYLTPIRGDRFFLRELRQPRKRSGQVAKNEKAAAMEDDATAGLIGGTRVGVL
jgi:hypothetical protein